MRFFFSYRRRADGDRSLAGYLADGLRASGHDVFVDINMAVGTDWANEINRRIEWCDVLVVLLSAESVESEMVQGEVRLAHHRRRPDGRPHILPIRVRYDGPLDYELNCYLARLQYLAWRTQEDSAVILEKLRGLSAANGGADFVPIAETVATANNLARPRVSVEPRLCRKQPGGAIRAGDPFYIRRDADDRIVDIAADIGETLIIKAPRQMGKSSLLNHYIDACHGAGKRWAFVDFQSFTNADFDNYLALLGHLTAMLLRCLDLDSGETAPAFDSQQQFSFFIEDHVIRQVSGPIVFAFDEVDCILGRPYQRDFFSLLRVWHNNRSQPLSVWEKVDLALVIATEPYLLIDRGDQSPFNVTPPIELAPFSRSALTELNSRYGAVLEAAALDQLFELLNGHPYLTRLAFYRLVAGDMSFPRLLQDAAAVDGPFGEHLRRLLLLMQEDAKKSPGKFIVALRQAIANGTVPDEDTYHRLHGAGLVTRRAGRVVPANLLYARLFKTVR